MIKNDDDWVMIGSTLEQEMSDDDDEDVYSAGIFRGEDMANDEYFDEEDFEWS